MLHRKLNSPAFAWGVIGGLSRLTRVN